MSEYRNLKDSQTGINLAKAYVAETQAQSRYYSYAEIALKERQAVISTVFSSTARHEQAHANLFYDYLITGMNNIFPTPTVFIPITMGTIEENLMASIDYERSDCSGLYHKYGEIALEEGFDMIANSFFAIATVEKWHMQRFVDYLERFKTEQLYVSDYPVTFECGNCGYRHVGTSAPELCPGCLRPKEYFRNLENVCFA